MSRLRDVMNEVRANPQSSKTWTKLGDLLMTEGQTNKAKESYQRALQLDHQNQAAQQGLANALAAALPTMPPEEAAPPANLSQVVRSGDLSEPRASIASVPSTPAEDFSKPPAIDAIPDFEDDIDDMASPDTITFADTIPEGANIGKVPPVFRDPEPLPEKPSRGRLWLGVATLSMIPFFCLCSLLLLVAYFSPW